MRDTQRYIYKWNIIMSRICCKGIKFFPPSYWLQEKKKTSNIPIMLKLLAGMMIFYYFLLLWDVWKFSIVDQAILRLNTWRCMRILQNLCDLVPLWMSIIQNNISVSCNTQNIHKESWHLMLLTQSATDFCLLMGQSSRANVYKFQILQ